MVTPDAIALLRAAEQGDTDEFLRTLTRCAKAEHARLDDEVDWPLIEIAAAQGRPAAQSLIRLRDSWGRLADTAAKAPRS